MSSIVLTGGGTAGHCIPHLAILPQLNEIFDNICYIGRENGIEKTLMSDTTDYFSIPTVKFQRSFTPKNLLIPFKLHSATRQAKKILQKLRPNVVFSKGGYVSLPVVLAAFSLKIPVVAHESDYTLGLANKITAKKCDKILTTFSDTSQNLKNGYFTGAPIRENLFYADKKLARKKFGFDEQKPIVLIFGGSSGSSNINKATTAAIYELIKTYNVLHICGKGNLSPNKKIVGYFQAEYLSDMASAYAACDVAVSRGGSNAICELIALKIPSLIIPLGRGQSRGDQIQNANYFKNKGMCLTLSDDELDENNLKNYIDKVFLSREKIKKAISGNPTIIGNRKIVEVLKSYAN